MHESLANALLSDSCFGINRIFNKKLIDPIKTIVHEKDRIPIVEPPFDGSLYAIN